MLAHVPLQQVQPRTPAPCMLTCGLCNDGGTHNRLRGIRCSVIVLLTVSVDTSCPYFSLLSLFLIKIHYKDRWLLLLVIKLIISFSSFWVSRRRSEIARTALCNFLNLHYLGY